MTWTRTDDVTEIELDVAYDGEDPLAALEEMLKAGGDTDRPVSIIKIVPSGPGGGWPQVTFRGEIADLKLMILNGYCRGEVDQAAEVFEAYGLDDIATDYADRS